MKVLFDHQTFSLQSYGGISRYFVEIIKHLPQQVSTEIGVTCSKNIYLQTLAKEAGLKIATSPKESVRFSNLFRSKRHTHQDKKEYELNRQKTIEALKRQDFDLFHPTYYDNYFLEYLGDKPFVLTIHDMIYELYPEMLGYFELAIEKAKLMRKASHIIAVSERTKQDIISISGVREDKISVIYHAASLCQEMPTKEKMPHLPTTYFLFVGSRGLYKNFLFLVQALLPVLQKNPELFILCTGNTFTKDETDFLRMRGVEDRFLHTFAEEDLLFYLYQHAVALLFPSYYEGFGIPILEAFSASCPVILSNTSCFPEIAKDAALYFHPKSVIELGEKVESLLHDTELRENLIGKGKQRLSDFSWEKSAEKTYAVYKKIFEQ